MVGKKYGKKADIWAVGVLMYYLMTTFYPFEGENDEEIAKKIVDYNFDREVIKLKSDYSDQAKDLIFKLLTEDPLQRFTAHDAINHVWFEDLRQEIVELGEQSMSLEMF